MMPRYSIYSVIVVKIIKAEKDIVSYGLSWVGTEFCLYGGFG